MNSVPEDWVPIWTGLATAFLRDGYCSLKAIEKWARGNKWHLRTVREALESMAVEGFDHDGETHLRLSGKVVPFLPLEVRDVRTYRQAGSAA